MVESHSAPRLILASASPRRRGLLTQAGVHFVCRPADVDETVLPGERADAAVRRLARAKAAAIADSAPESLVLGSDTLVVLDGVPLGKPRDLADARRMLRSLSGKTHCVMTGVSLLRRRPPLDDTWHTVTEVTFHDLSPETIEAYIARVHVLDKAGAYAIQEHGGMIIAGIRGSRSNVIGLPVEDVTERLAHALRAP